MTPSDKAVELAFEAYAKEMNRIPPGQGSTTHEDCLRAALSAAVPAMQEANAMPGREEIARRAAGAFYQDEAQFDRLTTREPWLAVADAIRALVPAPQPDMERIEAFKKSLHVTSPHDYRPWSQIETAFAALPAQERTWQPIETRPWRVMTREEYRSFFVKGRHIVQFDYDNVENVAVWLVDPQKMTEAELLCGLQDIGLIP